MWIRIVFPFYSMFRLRALGDGIASPGKRRLLPWGGRWATWLPFLFILLCCVTGQAFAQVNPSQVEAAFLRNFARYVAWPAHAFVNERAPWRIGILGGEDFDEVLEKTFKNRAEQGRSFEVFRAQTLDQLPACQIVFIGYKDAAKRRAVLARLKNQPVLTVGDAPEFLQEGGIVRFQVGERVEIGINLDQARAVSLTIQTQMLEVSREVLENGALRRWR